jgi:DNA repair photolyase
LWYVTLTPYGKDIEPNVPDKHEVIRSIQKLSEAVGSDNVIWRYDPVFLSAKYSKAYHKRAFESIASALKGYVKRTVVSYIDLYEKTKKNFPEVSEVSWSDQKELTQYFQKTAEATGMQVYMCLEDKRLGVYGVNTGGCMSKEMLEEALHISLAVPKLTNAREGCSCLLGNDIGAYNTCMHFCRYCYANYDRGTVLKNMQDHDPDSPLLIGHLQEGDVIREVRQVSWIDPQLKLEL